MSAASEIQYVWFVIELLRSRKRNRERDASRTAEMERQKARNKKNEISIDLRRWRRQRFRRQYISTLLECFGETPSSDLEMKSSLRSRRSLSLLYPFFLLLPLLPYTRRNMEMYSKPRWCAPFSLMLIQDAIRAAVNHPSRKVEEVPRASYTDTTTRVQRKFTETSSE